MKWFMAKLLRLREHLIYKKFLNGERPDEIADGLHLSVDDVDRIIWWRRSIDGEPDGGWF
jgi:hypothetical protein